MPDEKLVKIDVVFIDINNLNASVEETRKILDNEVRISGYYLMRYSGDINYLGIKFIVKDSDILDASNSIKEKIATINGFRGFTQENTEGEPTPESYLACITMQTRNKIFDLFEGEVSEQDYNKILTTLVHYISNPLLFDYKKEYEFCINHLRLLSNSL